MDSYYGESKFTQPMLTIGKFIATELCTEDTNDKTRRSNAEQMKDMVEFINILGFQFSIQNSVG